LPQEVISWAGHLGILASGTIQEVHSSSKIQ
jgi:hypothetical protein